MSGIHFIGNAHVDPAWMWRLGEGFESFVSTCRSALDRMDETEEFIFSASSAALYEFVEKTDKELFERICQRVQEGRWEIVGGWWIEPDCNLPSGESFLRQAQYAQEYFLSRFGKTCEVGFCIDSFGHNANLPQLLSQAGIKYYVFMRPGEDELHLDKPYFYWKAKTGEKVLAYRIPYHYSNFQHSVKEKVGLLESSPFYDASIPWMLFYGVGNHGGGPTKEQIQQIQELRSENKDVRFSSVLSYFKELEKAADIPEFELDIQHHAIGCYSAHSELKKLNREAENALIRAEKFCKLASEHGLYGADQNALVKAWKNVLLNQFHDTLGGVSIKQACDDAVELYHSGIATAKEEERLALYSIANKIDTSGSVETLVVFNPHPYEYATPVEFELWHPDASEKGIPLDSVVLIDDDGKEIPTQCIEASGKIGGDRVGFVALLPLRAFGWKKFAIKRNQLTKSTSEAVTIGEQILELFTKPHAIVYDDTSDTWGHGVARYDKVIGEFTVEDIRVIESGSLRSKVRIISHYDSSELIEDVIQYQDSDNVEVRTQLNWQEKRKMVKIRFPHESEKQSFVTEIPNSWMERPADGKEYPVILWVTAGELSIITDSKQSFSCDENYLSFIAARSPLYAHHAPPHENMVDGLHQDQGWQTFQYQLHLQKINTEILGRESEKFMQPASILIVSEHTGA
ncbi:MAG TPA: glycoside hydrolase family 38 C-terminal domain-containing protein [Candidatus Kapabacteria bacterium]